MVKNYENLSMVKAAFFSGCTKLANILETSGLAETLMLSENITLFAPEDNAFNMGEKDILEDLMKIGNEEKLIELLKYHLISIILPIKAVESLDDIKTMSGKKVQVYKDIDNASLSINDAKIIETDIKAKNGILHKINKILIPE